MRTNETGSKVLATTHTWAVFVFSQGNKIFYYEALQRNTSLLIINPFTDKIERNYTLPCMIFYHDNGTTITVERIFFIQKMV